MPKTSVIRLAVSIRLVTDGQPRNHIDNTPLAHVMRVKSDGLSLKLFFVRHCSDHSGLISITLRQSYDMFMTPVNRDCDMAFHRYLSMRQVNCGRICCHWHTCSLHEEYSHDMKLSTTLFTAWRYAQRGIWRWISVHLYLHHCAPKIVFLKQSHDVLPIWHAATSTIVRLVVSARHVVDSDEPQNTGMFGVLYNGVPGFISH